MIWLILEGLVTTAALVAAAVLEASRARRLEAERRLKKETRREAMDEDDRRGRESRPAKGPIGFGRD